MTFQDLLNERHAAARLAVSVRTLQSWRVVGGGPNYVKCGRLVRYREADLEAWITGNVRRHTAEERGS